MEYKDYYKILGIERSASPDQIKQAYRKLALKYHPDHNPGDKESEEKFKEINEANQVLSDPEKKSRYDSLGENYANYQQRGGAPGGFNWEDWYSPSQGSGTNFNVGDLNDLFGGGFSEFFTRIFGGTPDFGRTTTFNQGTQRVRMPKPSFDQEVEINLQEAYQGALRKLEIEGRRLEVKIPPGSRTGTRVRVADILPTTSQGQKGDLYLVIRVLEDKQFKRTGDDLITEIPVELANVVLGGEVTVDTLSGKVVLTIPAGTQPGQSFRLAGRGMPHLKNPKVFGDLIAQVKIQIPRNLTPDQRQKFEDFTRSLRP